MKNFPIQKKRPSRKRVYNLGELDLFCYCLSWKESKNALEAVLSVVDCGYVTEIL